MIPYVIIGASELMIIGANDLMNLIYEILM